MNVAYGSTRLVLLVNDKAIKIGRVRPLRSFVRMFLLPFSHKRRKHFLTKYGPGFVHAVRNDLCAGLIANRNEYEYYQESKDSRVMPTTKLLLNGWVIIQLRGQPISLDELSEGPHIKQRVDEESCEVTRETQFCRHPDGQIVLIDYGRNATCRALSATVLDVTPQL